MGVCHPYVLRVGDQFWMWYGGIDGRAGKDVKERPPHVRVEQMGLATSPDGIHWTRANDGEPVMKNGPRGSLDSIQATGMHILRIGEVFVMWYGAYNGRHTIGIATRPGRSALDQTERRRCGHRSEGNRAAGTVGLLRRQPIPDVLQYRLAIGWRTTGTLGLYLRRPATMA